MIPISVILYASYISLAFSYTIEAFLNKDTYVKYWYLTPLAIIWCALICLFYFPSDLGAKLYKKLS